MKRIKWLIALALVCLSCIGVTAAALAEGIATPVDLGDSNNVTVSLEKKSFTYNGKVQKPEKRDIVVTTQTGKVNPDWYEVKFVEENSIDVGTYVITVSPKTTNVKNQRTLTYTITARPITDSSVVVKLAEKTCTYDDTEKRPAVEITFDGKTLKEGTDYEVKYADNKDASDKAKVVITGKGNFTGEKTVYFTIKQKPISADAVTLAETEFTYNGEEHKPAVTVMDGTKTLTKNDYTVEYKNNTAAGTATATITGQGNYTGSITKSFTIKQKAMPADALTLSQTELTFNGKEQKPDVTVKDGKKNLVAGEDYTVSFTGDTTNVGTVTVTVTGKGNYTGSITGTYTIKPKNVSETTATLSASEFIYNGEEQKPAVTMVDGTTTMVENTDYTVSFSEDVVNVGTVTVTVTGKGNYTGTVTKTYDIQRKPVTVTAQDLQKYCGTVEPELTAVVTGLVDEADPIAYTLARDAGEAVGEYAITVTGEKDQGNYEVTFVNSKMTIGYAPVPAIKATMDGTMKDEWYFGEPVKVSYKGYTIAKDNEWAIDEKGVTGFASYITCADGHVKVTFRLRGEDGAITEPITISYKQDTKAPEFKLDDYTTHISLEATDKPGEGLIDISQASGVIISLWHNDRLEAEIKLEEMDPEKVTEADYTRAGDWVFFQPGTYVITITDVAGNEVEVFKRTYVDTDGDGLNDAFELSFDSDPAEVDTDHDGLDDLQEYQHKTNPRAVDTDGDGLTDSEELANDLNPNKGDTDDDGVDDMRALLMKHYYGFGDTFSALNIRLGFTMNSVAPALTNEEMEAALNTLTEVGRNYLEAMNITPYERKGGKVIFRGDKTINLQKFKNVNYVKSNADGSMLYGIYSEENLLVAFTTKNGIMRPTAAWSLEEIFGGSYSEYALVGSDGAQLLAIAPWDAANGCTLTNIAIIMPETGKVWQISNSAGASKFEVSPAGDKIAYLLGGVANLLDLISCNPLDAYTAAADTVFFMADGALVTSLNGNKATIFTVKNDALVQGEATYSGTFNKEQPTLTRMLVCVVLGQGDLDILNDLYEGYTFDVGINGIASSPASLNSLTYRQPENAFGARQNSFFKQK